MIHHEPFIVVQCCVSCCFSFTTRSTPSPPPRSETPLAMLCREPKRWAHTHTDIMLCACHHACEDLYDWSHDQLYHMLLPMPLPWSVFFTNTALVINTSLITIILLFIMFTSQITPYFPYSALLGPQPYVALIRRSQNWCPLCGIRNLTLHCCYLLRLSAACLTLGQAGLRSVFEGVEPPLL